jgi:hypothetical protein
MCFREKTKFSLNNLLLNKVICQVSLFFLRFFLMRLFFIRLFIAFNILSKSIQDYFQSENISLYPYDSFYKELKSAAQSTDHNHRRRAL